MAQVLPFLKIAFFLQENLHAQKVPRFKGGGVGFGGGERRFYFMGARIFLKRLLRNFLFEIGGQILNCSSEFSERVRIRIRIRSRIGLSRSNGGHPQR